MTDALGSRRRRTRSKCSANAADTTLAGESAGSRATKTENAFAAQLLFEHGPKEPPRSRRDLWKAQDERLRTSIGDKERDAREILISYSAFLDEIVVHECRSDIAEHGALSANGNPS